LQLSDNPIVLRIQLNNNLRIQPLQRSVQLAMDPGYLFKSMWLRLGLTSHILNTRPGSNAAEYIVTFRTFDAAAAFVNQVNHHWVDDEMTGQVYVSWDPIETRPSNTKATVMFPRATIEPWRKAAAEHGVEVSKYGYPMVDWGKSFLSALTRMKFTAGQTGDCLVWNIVGEYRHVVIMEITFKNTETMKWFVQRKAEHYLSNPWKDRFFVKQKDRYCFDYKGTC
jgi:hypothetical protein